MGDFMILGRQPDRLQMKRVPSITVKVQIPGHGDVAMDVPADSVDEALDIVTEWLVVTPESPDWRTIDATIDGQLKRIKFRASWVATFSASLPRQK